MIGKTIGNFRIEQKIGQGGMGSVYRGRDLTLERDVAIKVLRPDVAHQEGLAERFRFEALALARLNHPNIATLYTYLREGDDFYMIMEFVRGQALDTLLKSSGPLPYLRAIPLFCQALEGIGHAHDHGIIHRDIKPANLLLNELGLVKVTDFGISRVMGEAGITQAGRLVGTIAYMSPEQIRGRNPDCRTDIYSLGTLLYEMLSGSAPFANASEYETMRAQVEKEVPPLRRLVPGLPEAIEAAAMRALAKDPQARFATTAEFRDVLLASDIAFKSISGHYRRVFESAPTSPAMSLESMPTAPLTVPISSDPLPAPNTETPPPVFAAAAPPVAKPWKWYAAGLGLVLLLAGVFVFSLKTPEPVVPAPASAIPNPPPPPIASQDKEPASAPARTPLPEASAPGPNYEELLARSKTAHGEQLESALSEAAALDPARPEAYQRLISARLAAGAMDRATEAARAALAHGGQLSVPVLHNHRLGKCAGQLLITAARLRYVTEESRDGFDAGMDEVEVKDAGTLAGVQLKASGRSYRFIPVGEYRAASKVISSLLKR